MSARLLLALFVTSSLTFIPSGAEAQTQPAQFQLTVDSIMRGHALTGWPPRSPRWSYDGSRLYFEWKLASDTIEQEHDTWVVNRNGSGLRRLTRDESRHAPPITASWSRDRGRALFVAAGDVWLFDAVAGRSRRLTHTREAETNPRWTRDERRVTFVRGNNLFALSLDDASISQLTTILADGEQMPEEWDEPARTAAQELVREENLQLIETLQRRERKREEDLERRRRDQPDRPFRLQPGQSISSLQLTPDERYVIAVIEVRDPDARETIVPNYVTRTGYTETIPSRLKVGDGQPRRRLARIERGTGAVAWLDHGIEAQSLDSRSRTERVAEELVDQERLDDQTGTEAAVTETEMVPVEREVDAGQLVWSDDGTKAVMQLRSADNEDRWIKAFDPVTSTTRVLAHQHDPAWIGPLGAGVLGFLGDNETVYYVSEESGFAHLYVVPYSGGQARALTSGEWEVQGVELSRDREWFYLTTNEGSPFEQHLYRMSVRGGARVRLTTMAGANAAVVSPDGTLLGNIHSYSNRPPEVFIERIGRGNPPVRVTESPTAEFWSYRWIDPPIVHIPARDGAAVPGRLYQPPGWQPGGPAVIFVHGAGYLQNVHRWWSSYFREYMFHHLLMERGYMVLDLDFRASSGYGRDWRTAIYRHMGGTDLHDNIDGARWLVSEHGVDPARIGIYGGSYGGFITFMALFTEPGVFAAGAALRPVTDWAHYNHPYTSNILNTPVDDPEAYHRSSPIFHAEGLEGALLIAVPVIDVNVHFQDSVRLVQRLIELRKENWELAIYPLEDHGFVEEASWADEYKRILKLFEDHVRLRRP
jgi:dipeptidyl aminopeptidase/acylaminoacyl peptidase